MARINLVKPSVILSAERYTGAVVNAVNEYAMPLAAAITNINPGRELLALLVGFPIGVRATKTAMDVHTLKVK